MNNSSLGLDVKLEPEKQIDISPWLRQKEQELVQVIEALQNIASSSYWKVLKQKVFDGVLESLQRKISNESDDKEIYRLQGQIAWAEKYSNLDKLIEIYRKELQGIKKQLSGDGAPLSSS